MLRDYSGFSIVLLDQWLCTEMGLATLTQTLTKMFMFFFFYFCGTNVYFVNKGVRLYTIARFIQKSSIVNEIILSMCMEYLRLRGSEVESQNISRQTKSYICRENAISNLIALQNLYKITCSYYARVVINEFCFYVHF